MSHGGAAALAEGYAQPARYLQWYEDRNGADDLHRLSVRASLDLWARELPAGWLAARLGPVPRCLIEGCAVAGNVDTLFRFLMSQGIPRPDIHVIDLIDLAGLGRTDPRARYAQADAGDLSRLFGDGSIDLLLQDHLMNCAPFAAYDGIIGEMARLLRPGGLAVVNYTDPGLFPEAAGHPLASWLGADQTLRGPALEALSPAQRLIPVADGVMSVTLPFGNLEYFMPFDRLAERMAVAGLDLVELRISEGLDHTAEDGDGLGCRRHHCLLSPCPG